MRGGADDAYCILGIQFLFNLPFIVRISFRLLFSFNTLLHIQLPDDLANNSSDWLLLQRARGHSLCPILFIRPSTSILQFDLDEREMNKMENYDKEKEEAAEGIDDDIVQKPKQTYKVNYTQ